MGLDARGVLNRDDALLGRLVGKGLLPHQVADRVDPLVRRALVLVHLDLPVLLGLDPGVGELQRLGVGGPPAGDAEVVHLGLPIAVLHLDRALAGLDALHLGAGRDRDVLLLESALDHPRDVLVLGGEDLVQHLDQDHLGAEASIGGGDLGAGGARPDHCDPLRLLGERPGAPGVDHALAEFDARDRHRHRACGEHHRARFIGLVADLDVAVGCQRALALDHLDLVLVPEHLHPARQRFRDLGASSAERLPIEAGALYLDAELGAMERMLVELRGVEHGLRWDAGVVEAASAGLVLLDHGGPLAELGGADRGDIAAGATSDHDHVVGIGHPLDSITPPKASPAAPRPASRTAGRLRLPGRAREPT